jgi:hypothetical protein
MFIISCLFLWGESLVAYVNPRIRNLEAEIPDAILDEGDEDLDFGEAKPVAAG